MRVAIYTRVSTDMQAREGFSLDAQSNLLLKYVSDRNWVVHKVYSDEGLSAKNVNRPAFQQMLSDAKSNLFDVVIVWKLSRFSRSLKDLLNTIDFLKKQKVIFISYSEGFDMTNYTGRLICSILGAIAEFEREVTAENIRMVIEQAVLKGKRSIAYCSGYDVIEGKFVINKPVAKKIRALFNYFIETESVRKTVFFAESHQIKSYQGNVLCYPTVQAILKTLTYTGYNSFKGYVPCKHRVVPQIIDDDVFDRVQNILKRTCPAFSKRLGVKTIAEWLAAEPNFPEKF